MDNSFEVRIADRRGFGAAPTNDGLTLVVGGWPTEEYKANRHDVEGNWMQGLDLDSRVGERSGPHPRDEVLGHVGAELLPQAVRTGWALVGDAGYNKDFITAMGITDASVRRTPAGGLHDAGREHGRL